MNITVRFKRACAVLAAGATLAGGLVLLPTVAQAMEGKKETETKSGSYKITFISDLGDLEGTTGVVRQTDTNGKMKIEDIPDPVLPSYLADDHTSDKPWESDGWCHDPTFFNKDTDPINFRTETFTKDTKVWAHWNQQNYVTFINQDPTDPNGETTTQKFETFGIEHKLKEQPVDPPDYPGFVFQGWYNILADKYYNSAIGEGDDIVYMAKWVAQKSEDTSDQPGQTTPVDKTKQPVKDNDNTPAKDPAKKNTENNTLAKTGSAAAAPLIIAAGLCLAAGITLGLRRKLVL